MPLVNRIALLEQFTCLGDACPDTCCQKWSMQADKRTLSLYQSAAPELLEMIDVEPTGLPVMKRDACTQACLQLTNGLCGIHARYGAEFLVDACYFYPRVTRGLGEGIVMSAMLSCPEVARLALYGEEMPAVYAAPAETQRLPSEMKDYLPEQLDFASALEINRFFVEAAGKEEFSCEDILVRINSMARSLAHINMGQWPQAVPLYWNMAANAALKPLPKAEDPFNLLHALCGLVVATHKQPSAALSATINSIAHNLRVTLDWEQVSIATTDESLNAYLAIKASWDTIYHKQMQPVLKRWLQMQLSVSLFPFAGLGHTLSDRITLITMRFAMFKLALMNACALAGHIPPPEEVIAITYGMSRLLDHLGEAEFSLNICEETGWIREERLAGLLSG